MNPHRLRSRTRRGLILLGAAALLYGFSTAVAQADRSTDRTLVRLGSHHYYDPCYAYGRCSADDLRRLRDRLQRLDRVAPQPPEPTPPAAPIEHSRVPPTPEAHIHPEYRNSSQLREEWREQPAPAKEAEKR